ncbi:MAG: histidine phosphatase family protein [Desulfovibrionaceae bacterium]|nr:histidine phosphatase family protein [Desulfovibrionaceae bacterium]
MRLYLMQHGVCLPKEADPEQALSPVGREVVEKNARALRRMGLWFDAVVSSPKKRAVQTAAIVAETTGFPVQAIVQTDMLRATMQAENSLEFLKGLKAKQSVFAAGHLPSLGNVASLLLCKSGRVSLDIKNGGITCLETPTLAPGSATLMFMLTPAQLMYFSAA